MYRQEGAIAAEPLARRQSLQWDSEAGFAEQSTDNAPRRKRGGRYICRLRSKCFDHVSAISRGISKDIPFFFSKLKKINLKKEILNRVSLFILSHREYTE